MAASLLFLLPLALLWVLFVRPQQRRMRQAQAMVATLDVGDEVITTAGIYGTIVETDDTTVWLEIAPDVVVRTLRGAVAQHVPTDLDELVAHDQEQDHDDEDGEDDDDGHHDDGHGDNGGGDDVDETTHAPGSNGLSAGVPNTTTTPTSPRPESSTGDDEA